ncbi:hypothetical protein [Cryobacterium sp. Sr3]|uniref:hypothetical protein n=1 Tax=Cryobacterium sp. Sr3 TaxID=1259194 RepID=UPI001069F512|nr:hypothetical protein [Cryobacterium sp. Sr3]TFB59933.1 hypothetical protein E3N94_02810 [Cryobacterium sp. Sr3]
MHDEIVLSVPSDRAEEAETAVLKALQFSFAMHDADDAVLILAAKSERGRDWSDCYRSEKTAWPEVARDHRDQLACLDGHCTWHIEKNETRNAAEGHRLRISVSHPIDRVPLVGADKRQRTNEGTDLR